METNGLKILAIDDNQDNLTTLKAAMSDRLPGTKLLTAPNSQKGLELAFAEDPDVILLDILVSGVDGFAVCRKLKGDGHLWTIPVVFLTAIETDREIRVKALEAGAEGFLSSPIEEVELIAQIRAMAKIKAANRLQRLEQERLEALVDERTRELEQELVEHRQTETALRQSEERYRRITQTLTDYIVNVRVENGRAVETIHGLACEAVTGYSLEDLHNDPSLWIRMVHEEDREAVYQLAARVLAGETSEPLEHRIWRKDGVLRWVQNTTVSHYDSQGHLFSYDSLIRDIDVRKQAEMESERLRNLLQNIIDSMPSILIGVDREGRVTTWNNEAQRATGISDGKAVGQTLEAVLPEAAGQMEKVRAAIRERTMQKSERVTYWKDGEMKYLNVVAYPLNGDRAGEGVIRIDDVTQHVHLEEMMVQSEKMRVVGGLAAGITHEINNPLGAIMQATQNIQRRTSVGLAKNDEVARQCNTTLDAVQSYLQRRGVTDMLEDIRKSGARAARIVTSMLQFSRRDEAELAPACLSDLIERAIELAINDYDLKKQYDFRHIEIVREFDPSLPDVPCRGSEIEQVLLNLLKNSAQAMAEIKDLSAPSPRIIVRTRRDDNMTRIEVEDNGPGMTEHVRTRVFEPLFTTKQAGMGTGLGLAVAYMIIVNSHKGRITVESAPGKGAKFIIALPLAKSGA